MPAMTKEQAVETVIDLFRHMRSTTERAQRFQNLVNQQGRISYQQFLDAEDTLHEMAASFEFASCTHCDGVTAQPVESQRMREAVTVFGCVCPEPRRFSEDETEHNPDCTWRAAVENGRSWAATEQMKMASPDGELRLADNDIRAKAYQAYQRSNPQRHLVSADAKQWHTDIGFPEGFDIDKYQRGLPDTLVGSDHYEERRFAKGLPQLVSKQWVIEAQLITIMCEGGNLTRYAVRGPWNAGYDLTVAIDAAQGKLITGWFNRKGDWHRLTKSEYEQPSTGETPILGHPRQGCLTSTVTGDEHANP
jgi:hypothetical protein